MVTYYICIVIDFVTMSNVGGGYCTEFRVKYQLVISDFLYKLIRWEGKKRSLPIKERVTPKSWSILGEFSKASAVQTNIENSCLCRYVNCSRSLGEREGGANLGKECQ